jgi:hypothetical protein
MRSEIHREKKVVTLGKHHAYIRANFEDMPEVRDWVWTNETRLHGQRS